MFNISHRYIQCHYEVCYHYIIIFYYNKSMIQHLACSLKSILSTLLETLAGNVTLMYAVGNCS